VVVNSPAHAAPDRQPPATEHLAATWAADARSVVGWRRSAATCTWSRRRAAGRRSRGRIPASTVGTEQAVASTLAPGTPGG